jgi:hypothetical protein
MFTLLAVAAFLLGQANVGRDKTTDPADNPQIRTQIKAIVNEVLVAPTTATHDLVSSTPAKLASVPEYRGSLHYINRALSDAGFYILTGKVTSSNRLGVRLTSDWTAIIDPKALKLHRVSLGEHEIYAPKEFDDLIIQATKKFMTEVWKTYASEISLLEKQTAKIPYNHKVRWQKYWAVLNQRADTISKTYELTSPELETIFFLGIKLGWPTNNKEDFDNCKLMLKRKHKDVALAIKRAMADANMAALNAQTNALMESAAAAAYRHNSAVATWARSQVMPPGFR